MDNTKSKKNKIVYSNFRVTEEEKALIKEKAKASGLSLSDFQRKACLEPIMVVKDNIIDREAIHQLLKIGNNLNQIAKHANAMKMGYDSKRLHALLGRIESIIFEVL